MPNQNCSLKASKQASSLHLTPESRRQRCPVWLPCCHSTPLGQARDAADAGYKPPGCVRGNQEQLHCSLPAIPLCCCFSKSRLLTCPSDNNFQRIKQEEFPARSYSLEVQESNQEARSREQTWQGKGGHLTTSQHKGACSQISRAVLKVSSLLRTQTRAEQI